jgi:hypothetical protein
LNGITIEPRILETLGNRFRAQLLYRLVEMLAKRRHADAGDKNLAHV